MPITFVPLKSKPFDADGNWTRPWLELFRSIGQEGATAPAGQLILSVPGTLAIRSSAVPLTTFFGDVTVTQFLALLKTAPDGDDLVCVVRVDGVAIATITIADGETAGTTPTPVSIPVSAGSGIGVTPGLVTLDITNVGTTFPGADLTLLVGF